MAHLTPDALVDLAEGTRAEASAPHLAACEACRRQLAGLRAAMASAAAIEAPEPSPLFWDHLSSRVRATIDAEGAPPRSWVAARAWRRVAVPLVLGAAAVALVVSFTLRDAAAPPAAPVAPASVAQAPAPRTDSALSLPDDPSLRLVASLASGVDWDSASEAGLTTSLDRADTAIGDLSPTERDELERLLKQEMGRPGA